MNPSSVQPSFIPKSPDTPGAGYRPKRGMSFFTIIASLIFVLAIAAFGGAWFYRSYLTQANEDKRAQIQAEIQSLDTDLTRELTALKLKLDTSETLLEEHIAFSRFLELLGRITAQTVRFTDFGFNVLDGKYSVGMKGESLSYAAAAFQSDVFAKNPYLISPVFSNLSIDEKGVISFDVTMDIDPEILSYADQVRDNAQPVVPESVPALPVASSTPATATTTSATSSPTQP